MANSLIVGGLKCGMTVSIACPDAYRPDPAVLDFAQQYPGMLQCTPDILAAAKDADVLYTDVWASMGQEGESSQRKLVFEGYQINDAVMAAAHPGAMVQHCLPPPGEEITAAVFESHADEIFDEAENRLHAQKGRAVSAHEITEPAVPSTPRPLRGRGFFSYKNTHKTRRSELMFFPCFFES